MTRPLRIEYPGAYYHVTSRGNERKNIFANKGDRKSFLSYLKTAHLRYGAVIHVYCLMNNHYHLFIETPKGNLAQIMRHINGAYTNYFNIKHKRRGHLFQGRYKAVLVEAESYAGELSRYIHLNPVRAGMVQKPEEFIWSSYREYIGKRKQSDWLASDLILSYFDDNIQRAQGKYQVFVNAGLNNDSDKPLEKTVASTLLGSDDFIELIINKYVTFKGEDRNIPAQRELKASPNMAATHKKVISICNGDASRAKRITIYLFHRYSNKRLREIGDLFNIGESAVSDASRRFGEVIKRDRKLRKDIELLRDQLGF